MHKPVTNLHSHAPGARKSAYRYYVTCTCREASPLQLTAQEAEEWKLKHLRNVETALANAHRGKGSLASDMNHAKAMLDNPNVPKADKQIWQVIYDGARKRLGLPDPSKPAPAPHEGLW
jgi:hypothetical protein